MAVEGGQSIAQSEPVSIAEPCTDPQLGQADLDGDGFPDLILLTGAQGGTDRKLYVLWNDGSGAFSVAPIMLSATEDSPQAFTVVTSSSKQPLGVAFVTASELRWVGPIAKSRALPAPKTLYAGLSRGTGVVAADVNGDRVQDPRARRRRQAARAQSAAGRGAVRRAAIGLACCIAGLALPAHADPPTDLERAKESFKAGAAAYAAGVLPGGDSSVGRGVSAHTAARDRVLARAGRTPPVFRRPFATAFGPRDLAFSSVHRRRARRFAKVGRVGRALAAGTAGCGPTEGERAR